MPLAKGSSKKAVKARFHEFRKEKTYARTERKYGKTTARKQLIAVALGDRHGTKKGKRESKSKVKSAKKLKRVSGHKRK